MTHLLLISIGPVQDLWFGSLLSDLSAAVATKETP